MGGDIGNAIGSVTDAVGLTNHSGEKALDRQSQAADQANATQKYMYDTQREDAAPWRQAGGVALGQLASGDVFGGKGFEADPGYQFRMSEGMKAINSNAAARGGVNSGATLKALARYGQDFASNEYNNAYGRQYNRLSALAGFGQGANQQVSNAGTNYANAVSGNQIGVGNAAASNIMGQTGRLAGFIQGGMEAGAKALASDKRVKENISEVTREEIKELKETIKAVKFNYKDSSYGDGDFVGVMAQDLEKSKLGKTLVFEDKDGVKKIDTNKAISLLLAMIAEA
ncbi:MAG: tail fiber domain-containing protein [Alphaproteobacteria bacterium]|nr:tail fiber domain-containing protein [Alphaproteobacteria bacterium]